MSWPTDSLHSLVSPVSFKSYILLYEIHWVLGIKLDQTSTERLEYAFIFLRQTIFICIIDQVKMAEYFMAKCWPSALSSGEASLCSREAEEKEKGSTRGTMGRGKSPPRTFYFSILTIFTVIPSGSLWGGERAKCAEKNEANIQPSWPNKLSQ